MPYLPTILRAFPSITITTFSGQSLKREEINGQFVLKNDLNLLLGPKGSLQLEKGSLQLGKSSLQFGKYSLNCIKHLNCASWHKRFIAIEEMFPVVGKRFTVLHKRFIRSKLRSTVTYNTLSLNRKQ